jgi:uncharacterized repeat protein (TIGR02543 family)
MKKFSWIVALLIAFTLFFIGCEDDNGGNGDEYTVTFDANGGELTGAETVKVKDGEKVSKPSDPTRDAHDFLGWFKESGGINEWNFDTETVTANITLYAKWEFDSDNYFNVIFYSTPGQIFKEEALEIEDGEAVVEKPADPTRTGHTFDGKWYTDITRKNEFVFTTAIKEDLKLWAGWTHADYDIFVLIPDPELEKAFTEDGVQVSVEEAIERAKAAGRGHLADASWNLIIDAKRGSYFVVTIDTSEHTNPEAGPGWGVGTFGNVRNDDGEIVDGHNLRFVWSSGAAKGVLEATSVDVFEALRFRNPLLEESDEEFLYVNTYNGSRILAVELYAKKIADNEPELPGGAIAFISATGNGPFSFLDVLAINKAGEDFPHSYLEINVTNNGTNPYPGGRIGGAWDGANTMNISVSQNVVRINLSTLLALDGTDRTIIINLWGLDIDEIILFKGEAPPAVELYGTIDVNDNWQSWFEWAATDAPGSIKGKIARDRSREIILFNGYFKVFYEGNADQNGFTSGNGIASIGKVSFNAPSWDTSNPDEEFAPGALIQREREINISEMALEDPVGDPTIFINVYNGARITKVEIWKDNE